jgi:hypothetical protein
MTSTKRLTVLLCTWPLLAGCGAPTGAPAEARALVVPVSGKVLSADGKPVANAWVVFNPREIPGHEANAPTGADGSFRLSTFGKEDGAIPGRYVVTVEPHPYPKGRKPSIPGKYSTGKGSPLAVVIPKDKGGELPPFRLQ